jgi:hypothetical protein
MVEKFLREEELEEEARLLSQRIREADEQFVRESPASAFSDSAEDDSPIVGRDRVASPTKSAFSIDTPPSERERERASTPTMTKRPLPRFPSVDDFQQEEDDAELTIIEKSMDDMSMAVDDEEDDSMAMGMQEEEEDEGRSSLRVERTPSSHTEKSSPLLYWDESALDKVLAKSAEPSPPLSSTIFASPSKAVIQDNPVQRANSFRNGRPKITREGVQERLRLKQLTAAHETSPPLASPPLAAQSAARMMHTDPDRDAIQSLLSGSHSFTDDQLKSPLERLGSERYSSPSMSSFVDAIATEQASPISRTSSSEHGKSSSGRNDRGPTFQNSSSESEPEPTPTLDYLTTPPQGAQSPGSPNLHEREKALLAARRRSRSFRDGDSPPLDLLGLPSPIAQPASLAVPMGASLQRRRSMSTGDVVRSGLLAFDKLTLWQSPHLKSDFRVSSYVSTDNSKLTFSPSSPAPEFAALLSSELSSFIDSGNVRTGSSNFVVTECWTEIVSSC